MIPIKWSVALCGTNQGFFRDGALITASLQKEGNEYAQQAFLSTLEVRDQQCLYTTIQELQDKLLRYTNYLK